MSIQNTKYIPLHEAAKLTDYSQEYISLLCRRGKIKGEKLGRNWFTTKEWISDYVDKIKESKEVKSNKDKEEAISVKIKEKDEIYKMADAVDEVDMTNTTNETNATSEIFNVNSFLSTKKMMFATIIFSVIVSGFVFVQYGIKQEISKDQIYKVSDSIVQTMQKKVSSLNNSLNNLSGSFNNVKNNSIKVVANGIVGVSESLDGVKSGSTKFADNKITTVNNTLDDIKSKAVSFIKNLNNKKPDPRVAGVEDSDEDDSTISSRENDSTNEENGLIVIPLEGDIDSNENRELIKNISASFSDEVDVNPSEDGVSGIINPKNNPEENYLYLMVPVKEK